MAYVYTTAPAQHMRFNIWVTMMHVYNTYECINKTKNESMRKRLLQKHINLLNTVLSKMLQLYMQIYT